MKQVLVPRDELPAGAIPWVLRMKAVSREEPRRLVKSLCGAIVGCGGWILSRRVSITGQIEILFEFERRACLEMYSVLIATGLDLSQGAHRCFTEVCQCTRFALTPCLDEIVSVELQVQTLPSVFEQAAAIPE